MLSLDWILANGISVRNSVASGVLSLPYGDGLCSLEMHLSPAASLAYDLVLGRDWVLLCRDSQMDKPFALTAGIVNICNSIPLSPPSPIEASDLAMDVDSDNSHPPPHQCSPPSPIEASDLAMDVDSDNSHAPPHQCSSDIFPLPVQRRHIMLSFIIK
ncbi:hypothetical protein GGX14DRAFT_660283 [Mycena pura]|uniref:Uncharacterized protein n=1 Tax=Mycena pura TaxID=153505 RepID=A0AAD6V1B4_9AGAR|nr:hypothetical protein GGX14DRAFT_660283 [Mycena pura]